MSVLTPFVASVLESFNSFNYERRPKLTFLLQSEFKECRLSLFAFKCKEKSAKFFFIYINQNHVSFNYF